DAKMLDICMILQAEHGGGNNSTFTTHVVTSSGTDTYSCIAASLASLKGPRHGGANLKVAQMIENIMENVTSLDDDSICAYLEKILNKEVFDHLGLIYGLGHAVYSISDPRANILESQIEKYVEGKPKDDQYILFSKLKKLAPMVIAKNRTMFKDISVNIDFFSGYVYNLLKIPKELFTPIFAVSRIAGWSAHRLEELLNKGKIIRPAYIAVAPRQDYASLENRK
ncbi:MAG: citrate/2-methylcitrate synthase, partial [Clostridia bacterium]